MPIPEQLKHFIFECLDSVEALEILLALSHQPGRAMTALALAEELRLNVNSVAHRLRRLHACGLLAEDDGAYRYSPRTARIDGMVGDLTALYRTHRHRILETIISPMKKAHDFAQAFRVRTHRSKGEDNDG